MGSPRTTVRTTNTAAALRVRTTSLRNIVGMPRSSVLLRLSALALALATLAGCGVSNGSTSTTSETKHPARDELPASMDNGARERVARNGRKLVPTTRTCHDTLHATDQSLVVRARPDGPRAPDGSLAFTAGACIYLPPGYASGTEIYPVVYLLHGSGENAGDPITQGGVRKTMDRLVATDPDNAAIVVMPDSNDAQWYDGFDGKIRNETYLAGHVVPYVDRHFRTIASRRGRAITGVSNGGYGAILLAEKHPDLFVAAGGMSANLDWFGGRGLGNPGGPFYEANHPVRLISALSDTDVILDISTTCTSTDPADRCVDQGLDATFLPANRAFAALLQQVPGRTAVLDYHEGDGTHGWPTWAKTLRNRQLPFLLDRLADPRR
jgi:putative tributyrin esterase